MSHIYNPGTEKYKGALFFSSSQRYNEKETCGHRGITINGAKMSPELLLIIHFPTLLTSEYTDVRYFLYIGHLWIDSQYIILYHTPFFFFIGNYKNDI